MMILHRNAYFAFDFVLLEITTTFFENDFDIEFWKNIFAIENIYLPAKNYEFLMNLQIYFAKNFY